MVCRKKPRICYEKTEEKPDPFEYLPDDLVILILAKLSSSAFCPSDFINSLIVCKRFNRLGLSKIVLSKVCSRVFGLKAKNWCESAHRFFQLCVNAGSIEACYFLGMIRFYCLRNRASGASLMARAAVKCHAPAVYSLAVIQFNGSGSGKKEKDLRAGVALCARATCLGHVGALRELGHCLEDAYGVQQNIAKGRQFRLQADARELVIFKKLSRYVKKAFLGDTKKESGHVGLGCFSILTDSGNTVVVPEPHPANWFLIEWFKDRDLGSDLKLCSYPGCGRPETRALEFRRCSDCGKVSYCSRRCQAMDWKVRHKVECTPVDAGQVNPALGLVGGIVVDQNQQVMS